MRGVGGKGDSGAKGQKGQCLPLLLRLFLPLPDALSRYLLQEEEEGQEVFDRCAGCKTTPLYVSFLKGVSPGGVFERERTRAEQDLIFLFGSGISTHTFFRAFCVTERSQQTRARKEGRKGGSEEKGR